METNENIMPDNKWEQFREDVNRLRGNPQLKPSASIIIPVNACADLSNLRLLVTDLVKYQGSHTFEIITVINNYREGNQPHEVEILSEIGMRVLNIPDVHQPGETVAFSARLPGIETANSEITIQFDADCRIPNITPLLDFYVEQLNSGYMLAYAPVHFFNLPEDSTIPIRVRIHHTVRSIKRNLLKIPTPRGSSYAINRTILIRLYETRKLRDDIQIGPNIKALGGKSAYSDDWNLRVLTSGRKMRKGWWRMIRYVVRRLMFNLSFLRDTNAAKSILKSDKNGSYLEPGNS
jgi:Glycosyltransferase like family 2